MSVINAIEDYNKRQAGLKSGSRVWTVLMSNKDDGPILARQATGVPRRGDQFPGYPALLVIDVQAEAVSSCYFTVNVSYSTSDFSGGAGNPLDEPADVRWGQSQSIEPIDKDIHDNLIMNVVEEVYDPPLTEEVSRPVLTITRNQATFDINTLATYAKTVNSGTFYGAAAGEAKMQDIQAQRVIVGTTVAYWRIAYTIEFKLYHPNVTADKAWWKRVPNTGFRYRDTTTGPRGERNYVTFKEKDGVTPLNNPRPLTLAGLPLIAPGDATHVAGTFLTFETVRTADFSALGLE